MSKKNQNEKQPTTNLPSSRFDAKLLTTFSSEPGVYLMKDEDNQVLYVGKAKNLKKRLKQYFTLQDQRAVIPYLIEKVCFIETIIVNTEKEALLLENTLIKKHQPHYNMLLKDDKSFVSLEVKTSHPYPSVKIVRFKAKLPKKNLYFGPYTNAFAARKTLDLIHQLFPLRQCSDHELTARQRPCILYDIGKCIAPCVHRCSDETYASVVQEVVHFLKGHIKPVVTKLQEEIKKHCDHLDFEQAQKTYEVIQWLEKTFEKQNVQKHLGAQADAIGYFEKPPHIVITILNYDEGKLSGKNDFVFPQSAQEPEEALTSFILQHYLKSQMIPKNLLLPLQCDAQALESILSAHTDHKVHVSMPHKGLFKEYVDLATKNATLFWKKKASQALLSQTLLTDLQEVCELDHYPSHIECFDLSNLSGSNPTASMAVFIDGKKDPKLCRRYHLDPHISSDDYAALASVLTRRFDKDDLILPNLVIIDGGKGHLKRAFKVFEHLNIIGVDLISISKEKHKHTKGLLKEKIHTLKHRDPLELDPHSPLLFLIQNIRDTAHNLAISLQKKQRKKTLIKSALSEVKGIGPVKQKKLLLHFKSLDRILQASDKQLLEVPGMTQKDITSLRRWSDERTEETF